MPSDLVGIHWYQEYGLVSLVSFALGKEFALVFLASSGTVDIMLIPPPPGTFFPDKKGGELV